MATKATCGISEPPKPHRSVVSAASLTCQSPSKDGFRQDVVNPRAVSPGPVGASVLQLDLSRKILIFGFLPLHLFVDPIILPGGGPYRSDTGGEILGDLL